MGAQVQKACGPCAQGLMCKQVGLVYLQLFIFHNVCNGHVVPFSRSAFVPLYRCSAVSLCHFTVVPLCRSDAVSLCHFTVVPLCRSDAVLLCRCAIVPLLHCANVPLCRDVESQLMDL